MRVVLVRYTKASHEFLSLLEQYFFGDPIGMNLDNGCYLAMPALNG